MSAEAQVVVIGHVLFYGCGVLESRWSRDCLCYICAPAGTASEAREDQANN